MSATNQQVQQFVNERVRVRAEQIRNLLAAMKDDIASIGDVYAALATDPTWTDDRPDGPPFLLSPSDVLGWNAFVSDTITAMDAHGQLPVVLKGCVRPFRSE
jgi:hypothetical protein